MRQQVKKRVPQARGALQAKQMQPKITQAGIPGQQPGLRFISPGLMARNHYRNKNRVGQPSPELKAVENACSLILRPQAPTPEVHCGNCHQRLFIGGPTG